MPRLSAVNSFHFFRINGFPRNHIASKPRQLPFGVLAGLPLWRPRPRPSSARAAGEVGGQRRHPQRAHDRQLGGRPSASSARTSSSAPASSMRVEARVDGRRRALVALRQHQQPHGLASPRAPAARLRAASRRASAGALQHLQRAHDALRIGRHQPRRHARVARAQERVQLRRGRCAACCAPMGAHRRDRSPAPARGLPAAP